MIKIPSLMIFALIFGLYLNGVKAKEENLIVRKDCGVSFSVPGGLEYVEVDGVITTGDDLCDLAFNYKSALHRSSSADSPPTSEDWRALTDLAVTVEKVPLDVQLRKVESAGERSQSDIYKLISKDHTRLAGGDLYILSYSAAKPAAALIQPGEMERTVFVTGNDSRSTAYYLYSSKLNGGRSVKYLILKQLFSSFEFLGQK